MVITMIAKEGNIERGDAKTTGDMHDQTLQIQREVFEI